MYAFRLLILMNMELQHPKFSEPYLVEVEFCLWRSPLGAVGLPHNFSSRLGGAARQNLTPQGLNK